MARSSASTSRTLNRPVAVAVLAVLLVGLAVLALLQSIALHHQRAAGGGADTRPAAVVAAIGAASNEVVTLLTVQHATATADLKRLLDGSTAGFHDQLEKQAKTFRNALTAGQVTSTGSIAAAALVSMTGGDKAVVGIAAKATVKNKSSPKGEPRNYRLTVTVVKVSDHWLVSGLTFVV